MKRVTLFGSRATGKNRDDSDIDLIVDFPENTGLIAHVSLKYDLEDVFNLNVDVISRGGLKGSILEIDKEIEIYAA